MITSFEVGSEPQRVSADYPLPVVSGVRETELLASAARTASGQGDAVSLPDVGDAIALQLDVSDAAAASGDTLDVKVQTSLDGTNWIDVAAFTQVLGNGGAKRHVAKLVKGEPQAMFETGAALAAGSVRHVLGRRWRAVWTIAGSTPSFTFGVNAVRG